MSIGLASHLPTARSPAWPRTTLHTCSRASRPGRQSNTFICSPPRLDLPPPPWPPPPSFALLRPSQPGSSQANKPSPVAPPQSKRSNLSPAKGSRNTKNHTLPHPSPFLHGVGQLLYPLPQITREIVVHIATAPSVGPYAGRPCCSPSAATTAGNLRYSFPRTSSSLSFWQLPIPIPPTCGFIALAHGALVYAVPHFAP